MGLISRDTTWLPSTAWKCLWRWPQSWWAEGELFNGPHSLGCCCTSNTCSGQGAPLPTQTPLFRRITNALEWPWNIQCCFGKWRIRFTGPGREHPKWVYLRVLEEVEGKRVWSRFFHFRSFIDRTGGHVQVRALKNKQQSRYSHWQILLQARLSGWRLQDIKYFVSLSKLVNKEKVLPHKSLGLILIKSAFKPQLLLQYSAAGGGHRESHLCIQQQFMTGSISSQGSDIDTHRCPIRRFLHLKV